MPDSFDTRIIDLAGGPVNLMADSEVVAELAASPVERGTKIFVQNTSTRSKVYYAERPDAPARTARGHCLKPGDGFVLRLRDGLPLGAWVWVSSTGTVAVSPGTGRLKNADHQANSPNTSAGNGYTGR